MQIIFDYCPNGQFLKSDFSFQNRFSHVLLFLSTRNLVVTTTKRKVHKTSPIPYQQPFLILSLTSFLYSSSNSTRTFLQYIVMPWLHEYSKTQVEFSSPVSVNDPMIQDVRYDSLLPNGLFKLIEDFQWKKAQSRLQKFMQEASQWVTKDEVDNKPGWRRLPIHEICIRKPTQNIVAVLIDAYPSGVSEVDSYERTPLHYAIIHQASSDVVHLILDSCYEAKDVKDFFDKTPKDYLNSDDDELADALVQTREQIALRSRKIRDGCPQPFYHPGAFLTPQSKSRAVEDLLEEELAQARIESDVAYSERDILLAENNKLRSKIVDLKDSLKKKGEDVDGMNDLSERNRALNQLLGQYEKMNKALTESVKEKDAKINNLSSEKEQLKNTISILSKKLEEMLRTDKQQSNISSRVDNDDDADALDGVIETGDDESNKENLVPQVEIIKLEEKLAASVTERVLLEKEVSRLFSSNVSLEETVKKLEKGYFVVTEQLVERTRMMHQQTAAQSRD